MGKRKRGADINKTPPPSDFIPSSAHVKLQSKQRSRDQAESSATQHLPSIMDVMGSSLNRQQGHQSPLNQNHGSSRGILLRHSRHYLGRHYSRRNLTNHSDASPSNWMGTPLCDAKLSFKLVSEDHSDFQYRESRERAFHKLKRIRSSSSALNAVSTDMWKMECGICQKLLRKKPIMFGNSVSSSELSVVAVLVCGHVYHADCLELKTSHEDRWDPPCPLCKSQLS